MPGEIVLVIDDSPTILKVVQLVLTKAGFSVVTAPDGEAGVEAARAHQPDMILLDFVMPKLNGYQVCRALAADDQLKDLPVVLMSAKGDQVGERFVKVMGIVDYITKPFSPEAITAVVQHTIAKYAKRRAEEHTQPIIPGPSGFAGASSSPVSVDREKNEALDGLREEIVQAIAAKVATLLAQAPAPREDNDPFVPTGAAAIADAAREALADQAIEKLYGGAESSLRGDLAVIPLAEVLQLLATQSQSGILTASRGKGSVEVFFKGGKVDLAQASGVSDEFLLGRFIVELELMKEADLDDFIKQRAPGGKQLGAQLVKLGYLSEGELLQSISKQTSELIYEILRWNFGHFAFRATRELPPQVTQAGLGLEVDGILMEGFRRVDEWHLIEREIDNFEVIFLRNEDAIALMGRGRLTREELAMLEFVNGKNSVKEIIRQSRMGSFDVSKMLYRLLSIKLIRRRVTPVAV